MVEDFRTFFLENKIVFVIEILIAGRLIAFTLLQLPTATIKNDFFCFKIYLLNLESLKASAVLMTST